MVLVAWRDFWASLGIDVSLLRVLMSYFPLYHESPDKHAVFDQLDVVFVTPLVSTQPLFS